MIGGGCNGAGVLLDASTRGFRTLLIEKNDQCILALEMIHSEYQIYIDAYLENHLTDLEFLDSIRYHDSWRFPWTHYKLIFELAKNHNLKVIGLNTNGNLQKRDQFAADKLAEISQANPNSPLIVFYGELHITKNKIPELYNFTFDFVIGTLLVRL